MLCVLAVFIPSFAMTGAARALFVPLALAVGFAMIASYVLSSTFVPVLSVWLLRNRPHGHAPAAPRPTAYAGLVRAVTAVRWVVAPVFLVGTLAAVGLLGLGLGTEIFPQVDAGQFQFRLRAPTGTRIEQTEAMTQEALRFIGDEVRSAGGEVDISLGYVGVVHSAYPINTVYLWMGGPHESVMRVSLKPGPVRVEDLKARLREKLPAHLREWAARRWKEQGVSADEAERRAKEIRLSFEPADIVNEVMSFGSPTPIEVQVSGSNMAANREHAEKIRAELAKVPAIRDLQYGQPLDYPTVEVAVDREKLAASGATAADVAKAVTPFTSSSRFTVPNYWRDPASGIGYQVQVEVPQALVSSPRDLEAVPVAGVNGDRVLVRDVGRVREGTMPGQVDRYDMKRLVSLTANIQGDDLGDVAGDVARAIDAAGQPPKGVTVTVRGQVTPLNELFRGLGFGLVVAVVVIGLLLTAYFQSIRLALVAVAPVPAVLAGVAAALLLTGTTLNLQSFMGAIMAVGVATANSILFVTFAERARAGGMSAADAAVEGARSRVRAILMTSCAMVAGMIPMAVGFGEGGDQTAPLARAVVGGLTAGTLTTLFVLPAVFALVMGLWRPRPASLDPFDPASRHFVPEVMLTPEEEEDPRAP
jgi:multidrug efflux pump subunit AcrB